MGGAGGLQRDSARQGRCHVTIIVDGITCEAAEFLELNEHFEPLVEAVAEIAAGKASVDVNLGCHGTVHIEAAPAAAN